MIHTKDKLAEELRKAGLCEMAERAAGGYYHDYLSPLDMPEMALVCDLEKAANKSPKPWRYQQIMALRRRAINGDFDASMEESDDWARSAEGQDSFRLLHHTTEKNVVCPLCTTAQELATDIYGGTKAKPEDGDASLCFTCGGVTIFDSKAPGGLRLPNARERKRIDDDFDLQLVMASWRDHQHSRQQ